MALCLVSSRRLSKAAKSRPPQVLVRCFAAITTWTCWCIWQCADMYKQGPVWAFREGRERGRLTTAAGRAPARWHAPVADRLGAWPSVQTCIVPKRPCMTNLGRQAAVTTPVKACTGGGQHALHAVLRSLWRAHAGARCQERGRVALGAEPGRVYIAG